MEENKLLMTIQLTELNQFEKKNQIEDWLAFIRLLITPSYFQSSHQGMRPFELKRFHQVLLQEGPLDFGWFIIGNDGNEFSIHFDGKEIVMKNIFQKQLMDKHAAVIRDYIRTKMFQHGVFAYLRPYDEFVYNNTTDIDERLLIETKEEIRLLPKIKRADGEIIVDCNQFSGYDLSYQGLCFTSCWEMYYSSYYYRVIPKQIFLDVQQVEWVKEYESQVVAVQLYRDPFNWKAEVNQQFQAYYRDQLGFDHLAWDNGVGLLKTPFIEYAYTDKSVQSVQYQNRMMQPATKKKATFFVTRNYNFEKDEYKEKRIKGALNTQAYFPWVDEQRAQMMSYKVIDPSITLDNGIQAYCYYIREYLKVAVEDEKYQEYLLILRLYVPSDILKKVPLDEIREELSDIKFKRFRKRRGRLAFDVKKDIHHLRVEILDYPKLEQLATAQKS